MAKRNKAVLWRILLCALLFITAVSVRNPIARTIMLLVSYALVAYDILLKSAKNIARGQVFDENFLMSVASIGALIIGDYAEGVFVMLFYQVGELFQRIAVGKSRKSVADLMDICPDFANIMKDGVLTEVDPVELAVGDIIVVKPGEKIPVDGTVTEGHSYLDTSMLTGEATPREVCEGEAVISGCINTSAVISVRVDKEFTDSTVSRILELVENSAENKAQTENFVTKFAKYYTPIVVFCALALALIPPIFVGNMGLWVHRALTFLVISCPCALVISVPLSFFGGIGCASRNGILIKGAGFIEVLARCRTAVFDKTGTLTTGSFSVSEVSPEGDIDEGELIFLAAHAELFSNHPIAEAIKRKYGLAPDSERIKDQKEIPGMGIEASIDGKTVLVGNSALMEKFSIIPKEVPTSLAVVHIARGGEYLGCITISDKLKGETKAALRALRECGIDKTVMLTGDRREAAKEIAETAGLDELRAELLPGDKVSELERIMAGNEHGGRTMFVGDGVNDAPVLTRADVGIAMGALGSDAAIEAADVVIMNDSLSKIVSAIKIARRTLRIVKQNIAFSIFVKVLVLVLGACGKTGMMTAVFADVGVSVIAILNAMRCLKYSTKSS